VVVPRQRTLLRESCHRLTTPIIDVNVQLAALIVARRQAG
jgi:hypothetical protein